MTYQWKLCVQSDGIKSARYGMSSVHHQRPSILLIREGNATHILFVVQSLSDRDNPFTYETYFFTQKHLHK